MPQTENIVFQVQFMQMEPKECTSPVSEENSVVEKHRLTLTSGKVAIVFCPSSFQAKRSCHLTIQFVSV